MSPEKHTRMLQSVKHSVISCSRLRVIDCDIVAAGSGRVSTVVVKRLFVQDIAFKETVAVRTSRDWFVHCAID